MSKRMVNAFKFAADKLFVLKSTCATRIFTSTSSERYHGTESSREINEEYPTWIRGWCSFGG